MNAQRLTEEGDRYRRQGDNRGALERYNLALGVMPADPYLHLVKGITLQNLNEHEQALISLAEAQRLGYTEPYIVSWSMGISHLALNRLQEAISTLSSAARLKPDSAEIHDLLAGAYFQAKQYANAKRTALRATQLNDGLHRPHVVLGDANFYLGDYQEAANAYRRAVQIQPDAADTYHMLGRSYNMLSQDRESLQAYRQALRFKTKYQAETNYFMAWAHVRLRDFDAALNAFQQTIYLNPKIADAHLGLARVHKQQGRYEDAVASAQRFVDLRPTDGNGYIGLSWYHSFLRQHEAAARAGLKAIEYAPKDHMGYTNLCRALYDMGQYRESLARCQRALQLKPGDGETLFYLGRAHEALKDTVEAKRAFAGALTGMLEFVRKNPDEEDGHYLLGNIYLANNQPGSAIDAYRAAISLQPRFPLAYSNLGIAYLWAGDRQAAMAQYRALLSLNPDEADKLLRKIEPKKAGKR